MSAFGWSVLGSVGDVGVLGGSIWGLVVIELLFDSFPKMCHLLELKIFSLV